MSRVIFDNTPQAPAFNPGRADIACFVGLVRALGGATLPARTVSWLTSLGYSMSQIASITDVPVLLESYIAFTSIFDDAQAGTGSGTDYLATAVRSFFSQGGKRCYIVRVDSPITPGDSPQAKAAKLQKLLPSSNYAPDDSRSWTGIGNLSALEDVSFLVVPDLPALCASQPTGATGQAPAVPPGPEQFVLCSQADITPRQSRVFPSPAPRLTVTDYAVWAASVASIVNYLSSGALVHLPHLHEIQLVAAFPIPADFDPATDAENPSSAEIVQNTHQVLAAHLPEIPADDGEFSATNISSSFLQLAYPWLKTTGSSILLESLEPSDGVLVGLLARNALVNGTFTSATKITPAEIYDVWPALPAQETRSSATVLTWGPLAANTLPKPLIERLSLFGFTPSGLQLLSDVTAYPGESVRSGPVNRLVSTIWRAARHLGESAIFQSNGPSLWGRVQRSLQNLMTRLWTLNALNGSTASDAFNVRCDRTTMTQNDLDNGRLIAFVSFTPASTIETIRVKLAMETSGTSVQEITATLAEVS